MVSSIKWSWTETKHSPAWALAKMVLIWPQESCFSPVVAGVCGLPFKWHDAGLPQWSLQIRNPGWIPATFENWISFASTLSLSLSWFLTTFDLAHYCPLLKDLFFKMQVNYLIARAFGKYIEFVRRGVRLLVAPWRASSGQVNTKCSGHNLVFYCFFLFSLPSLHFHTLRLVSLPWRMGWSPLPSTSSRRKAPWPRPNTSLTI